VLSVDISERHAVNDSGCPNLPKLVASNSEIAGQSASVADRTGPRPETGRVARLPGTNSV